MSSKEEIQIKLIEWGLLDPEFKVTSGGVEINIQTGKWGNQSQSAWEKLCKIFSRDKEVFSLDGIGKPESLNDSEGKEAYMIASYYEKMGWFIARGNDVYNFIGLEAIDFEWKLNDDSPDFYNDLFVAFQVEFSGACRIAGRWNQTMEPGRRWTERPMNPAGAARIWLGNNGEGCQYKAWSVGMHGNSRPHEALVQVSDILVCRDKNKDYKRTGDRIHKGCFGINIHAGEGGTIGAWSAGCQVIQGFSNHKQRMQLAKSDRRYKANNNYEFIYSVVDAAKIF